MKADKGSTFSDYRFDYYCSGEQYKVNWFARASSAGKCLVLIFVGELDSLLRTGCSKTGFSRFGEYSV